MREPFVSVREDVLQYERCLSCHITEDLVEIRIGNVIEIICRSCLTNLNELANGARDRAVLDQARKSEASYKRLYEDLLTMTDAGAKHLEVCALSQLWLLLGASNQTEAVAAIKTFLANEEK